MYTDRIRKLAPKYDPRLVEAWMRLERGTLDALSSGQFKVEVRIACQCINADPEGSKRLADSIMGPARDTTILAAG